MIWIAVAVVAVLAACTVLAVALAVGIGWLGSIPRPDLRRRKRSGSDGNSGK